MNKIYRRLWSSARQCWVVASELSCTRGKRADRRGLSATRAICATAIALAFAPVAQATYFVGCGTGTGNGFVGCTPFIGQSDSTPYANSSLSSHNFMSMGAGAQTDGGYSTSFGNYTVANGDYVAVFGYGAKTTNGYSSVFGARSLGDGIGTSVFGNHAKAFGENSIAFGSGAQTASGGGESRVAIGGDAYAGSSGWTGAIAVGGRARAEQDAVALGYEAVASGEKSQAMGRGAKATATGATAIGAASRASGEQALAMGTRADASGRQALALGEGAVARGWSAFAIGADAKSEAESGMALGYQARVSGTSAVRAVALGERANAAHADSVALGAKSVTTAGNQVSVGSISLKRKIVFVADGVVSPTSSEAVNGGQLWDARELAERGIYDAAQAKRTADQALINTRLVTEVSGNQIRVGGENTGNVVNVSNKSGEMRYINGVRNGTLSATSTDAVTGQQLFTTNQKMEVAARTLATGNVIDASRKATATGDLAVALGQSAKANGVAAIALGNSAVAEGGNTIAMGSAAGATGSFAVALGGNAKATHDNSVALGEKSVTTGAKQVSVGSASMKRRIVNVEDGTVNAASSEAVTGKQLFATNTQLTATAARLEAEALALGKAAAAEGAGANAATAVGQASKAYNERSLAVGNDARAGVDASGNKVATGKAGVALGSGTRSGESSTAAGDSAQAVGKQSVAVGAQAKATGLLSTALGYGAQATTGQATALGRESVASGSYSTALGNLSKATAESAMALGDRAGAGHYRSVALGSQSVTTGNEQVSVGNASLNLKRKIVNLQDGAVNATSAEAVTGKQLHTTNAEIVSVRAVAAAAQTSADRARATADDALGKANALGGLLSESAPDGNLRLGGHNSGNVLDVSNSSGVGRSLTGLADGAINATSTEAVTGKQLQATHDRLATAQSRADAAHAGATAAQTTADQAKAKANATGNAVATAAVIEDRNRATATGNLAMAMGQAAKANGVAAFAMGHSAVASGNNAVSVGSASAASARAAVALGGNAKAKHENSVALGEGSETAGNDEVSVGNAATDMQRRIVNVDDARLTDSSTDAVTGKQLFATNEKVQANESVLAGHTSDLAAQSGRIAETRRDLDALRSEFEDFDPDLDGVVKFAGDGSVDVAGGKVRGVAAGDISSATSTDAVNGGQLFSTNERVNSLESDGRLVALGREAGAERAEAGDYGVAIGNGAQAALNSDGGTAIGSFSSALGENSVALGRGSLVSDFAALGFALGTAARVEARLGVALGAYAKVDASAVGSVALGTHSEASEENVVSVGNGTIKRKIVNVGRGGQSDDGAVVGQVTDALAAVGGGARMDSSGNIIAPTYNVQGGTQNNVGDALAALDSAVVTADSRVDNLEGKFRSAFQEGLSVRADGLNQLVLTGANGSVLTNLADGRVAAGSRDAVTGSQLFEAKQEIARNRSDLDDMQRRGSISALGALELDGSVLADVHFGGARLTGVSDGRISSASSDVVTGAQLFGTNERVSNLETSGRVVAVSSKNEWNSHAKVGKDSVAVGEYAAASVGSEGGTAAGHYAQANSKNSVAIGQSSWVSSFNEGGVAIGSRARADGPRSVAIGDGAWVFAGADNSVAVGAGSESMRSNEFSIGNYSNRRRLTHVANGIRSYDAATAGQLRESLEVFGGGSTLDAQGNVVAPTYRVQGGVQSKVGDALASLDSAVVSNTTRTDRVESQLRAVFQDSPGVRSDGLNQLTFAGANGMVLSNVANGAIAAGSRDAVNGGQLHSMQQQLNGRMDGLEQRIDGQPQSRAFTVAAADAGTPSTVPVTPAEADTPSAATPPSSSDNRVVADAGNAPKSSPQPQAEAPKPESPKPQVDTAELEKMLARANEYSDGISREVDARLDKMDKRFNRMAAMTSAQSAMAMNTAGLNTYNRLGAGVGYSEGESAMAVGYQRVLNDKGSATFSLNGAFTNSGERSMGVGVGIGW